VRKAIGFAVVMTLALLALAAVSFARMTIVPNFGGYSGPTSQANEMRARIKVLRVGDRLAAALDIPVALRCVVGQRSEPGGVFHFRTTGWPGKERATLGKPLPIRREGFGRQTMIREPAAAGHGPARIRFHISGEFESSKTVVGGMQILEYRVAPSMSSPEGKACPLSRVNYKARHR
jgi:hypothetical protein